MQIHEHELQWSASGLHMLVPIQSQGLLLRGGMSCCEHTGASLESFPRSTIDSEVATGCSPATTSCR